MNKTERYRLEALLELAQAHPGSLTVAAIARRRGIPAPFLRRLLAEMARAGTVASTRGPVGGIRLASPPGDVGLAALALPQRSSSASSAVSWLEERLEAAQHRVLASLSLASLVAVERERRTTADWQI